MSTTTGPRASGWYPDPDDAGGLRHWDGKAWGPERRPRPSWAGGRGGGGGVPPESPEPAAASESQPSPPPGSRRRWWLYATAGVLAALVFGVGLSNLRRGPAIPDRTVTDVRYTNQAQAACKRVLPELRRQRPQPGDKPKDEAEVVADKADQAANELTDLVVELRGLPVAGRDGARIDNWLDDWDSYIAVGRRYTAALRRGDNNAPRQVAQEADPLTRRVYLFSHANGMPECVL